METVGIVLNIYQDRAEEFEQAFRENELPTWEDFYGRRRFLAAALSRMNISTRTVEGAVQYLLTIILADGAHHEHDDDPRFKAWDAKADEYQIAAPFVFGGRVIVNQGP